MKKKTHRLIAFALVTVLFNCYSFAISLPVFIAANDTNIQYIGRFDTRKPNAPSVSWVGTEIKARFTGTSIKASFVYSGQNNSMYYNVIIDGKLSVLLLSNQLKYTLATGLKDTIHTIRLIKRNSPWSKVVFNGFELDTDKKLVPTAKRSARKIEFYGDSMTQGAQVDVVGNGPDVGPIIYDNNYNSYASMVAREFNAEMSCIAQNGAKLTQTNGKLDIPSVYNKIYPDVKSISWNMSNWIPDVVCINLIENEYPFPGGDTFKVTYIKFVDTLRVKYPNAHIFLLSSQLSMASQYIKIRDVVNALNKKGDKKVHFIRTPKSYSQGHNRYADNLVATDTVVEHIKAVIWSNTYNLPEEPIIYYDSTTNSVNEINKISNINIFPNPCNGILNINTDGLIGEKSLKIFNVEGNLVYHQRLFNNNSEIDISKTNLLGVYIAQVTGKTDVFSQKIIFNTR